MIVGELRTMAVHEWRDKARLGIAYAQAGTPVMIFQHGEPSAVLIAGDEVARWVAIEGSFSALHGLDVYPELADDTSSLGSLLAGGERPSAAASRRLAREPRVASAEAAASSTGAPTHARWRGISGAPATTPTR